MNTAAKLGIVHAITVQHAAEHHDRTGHEVTGETGIAYRWPRRAK